MKNVGWKVGDTIESVSGKKFKLGLYDNNVVTVQLIADDLKAVITYDRKEFHQVFGQMKLAGASLI